MMGYIITKNDLTESQKNKKIFVVKNFDKNFPSWSDINDLYELSKKTKYLDFNSFATMIIANPHQKVNFYKDIIELLSNLHEGSLQFSMTIIGFINRTNNINDDLNAKSLSNKFFIDNPKKIPQEVIVSDKTAKPAEYFDPEIHSDPEDRFFVQGSGQTLWKIFDDKQKITDEVLLNSGDLAYIPKGLLHSVEALSPRHSVSLAFA